MKPRKYQLAIALESTKVLHKIMGIHRKRPVVMTRWRKLSKYMKRALQGSGTGA
jgi:ribosomal protein L34E